MTLQIKELSVKIKVTEEKPQVSSSAMHSDALLTARDKAALIEECIERVLEQLERQNQR